MRALQIRWPLSLLPLLLLAAAGCEGGEHSPPLFELLTPEATGVSFRNDLPEQPDFNILNYLYYYNGGGVAVGDVDGNGYLDLFFTANLGPDRLYLNHGDYRFEDVTERAGVAGSEGWSSGATMADVNGDGAVDIYVSGVSYGASRGGNVLYINNGDGTFVDRTREFGLEHEGYSTQALFFDYDADGDLDMYLLNHSTHEERSGERSSSDTGRHPAAGDRLFRNDGRRFSDVTEAAGIRSGAEGYGLGVVASDLNLDGCIDIYVANDFEGDDLLYLNGCDGTFSESLRSAMGHTSRFSMGVDAADFDNDARPDVFVADMLPEREEILKTSANAESYRTFELRMRAGYHPQYARNTLQLNRGAGRFSEVGYLAGVHATDWSWAALFADLDNDGWKDLFVTNGIYRRPNDLDYIHYVGQAAIQRSLAQGITRENLAVHEHMPQVAIANHAFRNNGDLSFSNVAERWGLAQTGFSNGAVYADLNNSGSLDLVVNNINAPASVYRNRGREISPHHYLTVRLRGTAGNPDGIGAKVVVKHDGRTQMVEQVPTRGFQSSVDPRPHFGLGVSDRADTVLVIWPDRLYELLVDVPADTILTLSQQSATGVYRPAGPFESETIFTDVTAGSEIEYVHRETPFFDFTREPLMPHQLSREGPAMAVADVNGDGRADLFVGGAKWQAARLFTQEEDGTFRPRDVAALAADSLPEDVDAIFLDVEGDGDADLYVVSGGNEFWGESEALRDRLYLNDGRGEFTRSRAPLPFGNRGAVAAADYDRDGDIDLFVGSRVIAREYGRTPRSHLLQNDGAGRFHDVTEEVAPELAEVGMVSSAAWLGGSGGRPLELVVVGEWMPVRIFRALSGRLVERTEEAGLAGSEGWWNHVEVADLNSDGSDDLILGNLGLNSYLRATPADPVKMYVHDFAGDGTLQQILTTSRDGSSHPLHGRDDLLSAMPTLRARYPTYASFGATTVEEIFSPEQLRQADVREAKTFASAIALRDADGRYSLMELPVEAQFAPIYASAADDFNGDGSIDLLLGGNFHGVTPLRGRYDASYGLLLEGDGTGHFRAVDAPRSGVVIDGEIRVLASLGRTARGSLVAVALNDDTLRVLRWSRAMDSLTLDVTGPH